MGGGRARWGRLGVGLDEETSCLSGDREQGWVPLTLVRVCVRICARERVCMCTHMSTHVHMRVRARRGLTLLTPRAHGAGFTHTQAADGVAAPVACTAVAGEAAVGAPVAGVTGCNRAAKAGHPAQVPTVGSGVGRDAWTPGRYLSGS